MALAAMLAAGASPSVGARNTVTLAPGQSIQQAIVQAGEGDTILLEPGEFQGNIVIDRKVTLAGKPGAIVKGSGAGNVITVKAADAVVRGLTVRGSGRDLPAMDSGIFVEQSAARAVIEENRIEGNLYGVYLHGAPDSVAQRNVIVGIRAGRINEMGNGISVWNAPGAKALDNDIRFGRDGIFSISSKRNTYQGNRFRDLRFAIHYMYTNDSKIDNNLSRNNTSGFALMFSNRLEVHNNISDHDRDRGILFNYANSSDIAGNVVIGGLQPAARWATSGMRDDDADMPKSADESQAETAGGPRVGPEKCVFIYNANKNRIHDNWFEGCEIGVHFTAGSEGNEMIGNAFIRNQIQVKYVGTRILDWSKNGRGNYWSDNPAFDLNGDGVGDTAYRPNDLIDKVLWTAPQAKVLVNSPAVQVIRWAQTQFPALLPGGVIDSAPLISPPPHVEPSQASP